MNHPDVKENGDTQQAPLPQENNAQVLSKETHTDLNDIGWRSIRWDVFRPPANKMLFTVLVSNGLQLLLTAILTLFLGALGAFYPAKSGCPLHYVITCYILMAVPGGYSSARIYKMFGGEKWKSNMMLTALFIQSVMFGALLLLDMVYWFKVSSASLPFTTVLVLLSLWLFAATPLTCLGYYYGQLQPAIRNPGEINSCARVIPQGNGRRKLMPLSLLSAALPIGCTFIQVFFLLGCFWLYYIYSYFGFLLVQFLLLIVMSALIANLTAFSFLNTEDYNWWWRSFMTTGFTAVYLFIYCIHFFLTKVAISGTASTFLFFGYTIMMVFIFFLITGCIGFFATFWFVRKLYSSTSSITQQQEKGTPVKLSLLTTDIVPCEVHGTSHA